MLRSFVFGTLILCFTVSALADKPFETAPAESKDMKSLFNGKDLDGWDGDTRLWEVRDGVIRGETTAKVPSDGNTFLIFKEDVSDFDLRLSFRCTAANNSGIQYRSQPVPPRKKSNNKWVLRGYQHELRNEEDFDDVPSFIYDEKGSRGRICLVGEKAVWKASGKEVSDGGLINQAEFKELMKVDDWNDVVIIAKGNHIQHYLNGRLVLDFTEEHPTKGFTKGKLGLQLHAGKPMWTEFKNIRMKTL